MKARKAATLYGRHTAVRLLVRNTGPVALTSSSAACSQLEKGRPKIGFEDFKLQWPLPDQAPKAKANDLEGLPGQLEALAASA